MGIATHRQNRYQYLMGLADQIKADRDNAFREVMEAELIGNVARIENRRKAVEFLNESLAKHVDWVINTFPEEYANDETRWGSDMA